MNLFEVIVLGLIQGVTEFLPISSSAHLALFTHFFGDKPDLFFEIALHFGSLLALLLYFRKKLLLILLNFKDNKVLLRNIIFASLPVLFCGLMFKLIDFSLLDSRNIIAFNLIIWGIAFVLIDRFMASKTKGITELTIKDSFIIGLFQSFSLLSGTSRSGSTFIGGILRKLSKKDAIEFAFLVGIPVLTLASSTLILDIFTSSESSINPIIIVCGFVSSFVSSLLTIKFFINMVSRINFKYFGYYRILFGLIILLTI